MSKPRLTDANLAEILAVAECPDDKWVLGQMLGDVPRLVAELRWHREQTGFSLTQTIDRQQVELERLQERNEALEVLLAGDAEELVNAVREAARRVHIQGHSLRLTVQECGMPPCPAVRALLEALGEKGEG